MKKIVVAGAGHGGLIAATLLAKNRYDVTVVELKEKDKTGHDWHDMMDIPVFAAAGIETPEKKDYHEADSIYYRSPSKKALIPTQFDESKQAIQIDRKFLLNHLINQAEQAGAKILFGQKIIRPICNGAWVSGIVASDGEKEIEYTADLVIDAAGMYSPVRSNLPSHFGILKDIEDQNIFEIYRAYFKNETGETVENSYTVDMFHMDKPGIDWAIVNEEYVDLLIGKFRMCGKLTEQEIDASIQEYKKVYPFMGEEIIRGGSIAEIPIRRMLSMIVANGYAAVGDSAGMTVPLNGSGIILSMLAGKILADVVLEAGEKELTRAVLWKYEYEYFTKNGKDLVIIDIIKNFFTYVSGNDVNYLLENGVISAKEIAIADGMPLEITPSYIYRQAKTCLPLAPLLPSLLKVFKTIPSMPFVIASIPQEYDEYKVSKWVEKYDAL